jgi:hypothetical protein
MKDLLNKVETLWCETMHDRVMWPIHGHYKCSTCLREYPVAFHDTEAQRHRESQLSNVYVPASSRQWTASPSA